ncbi:hypothetical protein [Streptomyces sp. NPDC018584]|uniref:hypothetical protein n=1 Tax=unclassified Streptomyces TaxID=2593676 RepID=UPI0037AEFF94
MPLTVELPTVWLSTAGLTTVGVPAAGLTTVGPPTTGVPAAGLAVVGSASRRAVSRPRRAATVTASTGGALAGPSSR